MKCFNFLKHVHKCKHLWQYDLHTNQQVCLVCSVIRPIEFAE